nr:uncharacterized mitochondrial protein AtMg00810-like [Tanacetum cinerariifolium]
MIGDKTIKEEVYVCQPPRFEDPDHPDKVYKVVKALYGLSQAHRVWYETLANYLLENDFQRGKIDQTLFIKRQKGDILLVQIYVDDIIFGATNKDLCKSSEKLMKDKFQMSSIGELTFFLGLQVKQKKDGIFISQDKYVAEILRKFGLTEGKSASTPIDTEKPLLKDPYGEDVDVHTYRLQALVDKKKVVVTEATIREALCLDDAKGVDCLPNEEIFTELARMGYEKPSTKLTLVRNLDSTTNFYMYTRFLQLIIRNQVGDLSTHTTKYTLPALTQKVFANMKRVGKRFSKVETPLFEGMLVEQEIDEEGDADEHVEEVNTGDAAEGDDSVAHGEVPTVAKEQPFHLLHHLLHHHNHLKISFQHPSLLQEAMDACAALTRRVEHLEYDKVAQALEITKLKKRVKKLEKRNKVRVLKLRRLQRVGISQRVETSDDTVMDDESNQERMIAEMDQDDAVVLKDDKEVDDVVKDIEKAKVDESAQDQGRQPEFQAEIYKIDMDHANKVLSMQEDETEPAEVQVVVDVVTTAKLITEVVTAANETVTVASAIITTAEAQVPTATTATLTAAPTRVAVAPSRRRKGVDEAIDHVKRKAKEDLAVKKYQAIKRKPQTEAQARKNMMMYLNNTKEQIEEDENKALQKINETPAERAVKRRKLDEEVEDLKRHLQIVPNENDDVYTEATPLARNVPVVDYEIIKMNNKPYYKIIRADGTHQLYISFLTLLMNFDREDLEALWSLVKEIFSTAKPKNFSDDFLLTTLRAMFKTPDAHAQIWKNQRSVHGQELEATGIMWCTDHNFYNHTANFVSGEEVPTLKIYSRPDAECCKTSSRRGE